MFKGYKLKEISFGENFDHYYDIGYAQYVKIENKVKYNLDLFLGDNKELDGNKIINSWFPEIKADIFLSHSHNDKDIVIAFAGWLKSCFNLTVFIDSCVWGYGNDLCEIIDQEYSLINKNPNLYNYEKTLLTSSHVHMMLSTALASMIDKTECVIFYKTPSSIKMYKNRLKTESPWIYSEILFSEIMRITFPERLQSINENYTALFSEGLGNLEKGLKINYDINDKHLKAIDVNTLTNWLKNSKRIKGVKALDKLYELTFPLI